MKDCKGCVVFVSLQAGRWWSWWSTWKTDHWTRFWGWVLRTKAHLGPALTYCYDCTVLFVRCLEICFFFPFIIFLQCPVFLCSSVFESLSPFFSNTTVTSPSSSWLACCAASPRVWSICPTWATFTETWRLGTSWSTATWCVKFQTSACPESWRTTRRRPTLRRYIWHNPSNNNQLIY